jgi:hypothetical protein
MREAMVGGLHAEQFRPTARLRLAAKAETGSPLANMLDRGQYPELSLPLCRLSVCLNF